MSRVVLVAPDARLERHVRLLLPEDVLVVAPAAPEAFAERLSRLPRRPELILFGNQLPSRSALELAAASRQFAHVMTLVSDEQDIYVDAMRAGVSDVFPSTFDLDTIAVVIARAHDYAMDAAAAGRPAFAPVIARPGRVVAVASPKGGVGKTTVACNLAAGLARSHPGQVVLVDLDLQFGDVAASLGLAPDRYLDDAVSRPAARDSLVLKTMLTPHPDGFLALCAPESPATADRIRPAQVAHMLTQLADEFAWVIVDTSPGLTEHTLTVLELATDVVAITSMDISSVRGMRKELDVLDELGLLPEARQVVVNFADRSTGISIADIEAAIGARVDVALHRTKAVGLATNRGIPVLIDDPRDKASADLRVLVRRLESTPTRRSWREAGRKERVS